MSHNISGVITKKENLDKIEFVNYCLLPQGFAFLLNKDLPEDFSGDYARIWTSYFGGGGEQSATCIINGEIAYEHEEDMDDEDTWGQNPINEALKLLGVEKGSSDEFDALNLGHYRETVDFGCDHDEDRF